MTEYTTAIRAARTAARFRRYMRDAGLFPNVRWLPSRAVDPREVHRKYYNTVRALTDPWWKTHYPGCLWNCQCDMENTADPITHIGDRPVIPGETSTKEDGPATVPGLDRNPAFTGSIFTDNHPYVQKAYPGAGEAVEQFIGKELSKEEIKQSRSIVREWAKTNLIGKRVQVKELDKPVSFTSTGIKEALNQPHKHLLEKNEAVRHIESMLKEAEYVRFDPDIKDNKMVKGYHYYRIEISGEPSFVVIRELNTGELLFYSIVEKLKGK